MYGLRVHVAVAVTCIICGGATVREAGNENDRYRWARIRSGTDPTFDPRTTPETVMVDRCQREGCVGRVHALLVWA